MATIAELVEARANAKPILGLCSSRECTGADQRELLLEARRRALAAGGPLVNQLTFSGCSVSGAFVSSCERYRYLLTRMWDQGPRVCWVMLNPSTADASKDDATVRRCVGFSRAWGYGSLAVVNLFAFRSTDWRALTTVEDPIGPDNDRIVVANASQAQLVVTAWGAHVRHRLLYPRVATVRALLERGGVELSYLDLTADGEPVHPLRQPSSRRPLPWGAAR